MSNAFLRLARSVLLALAYALVAKGSLSLDAIEHFATLVWPPTGLALWAALRFGSGVWPGIALGAFVANVWQGAPASAAVGIAAGNTLEAVLGAYLLRRSSFHSSFDRLTDVAAFVGLGVVAATFVSATVGPVSLWAAGVIPGRHLLETSVAWWIGDACGALVVGSLLLAWTGSESKPRFSNRAFEVITLSVLFILSAVALLAGPGISHSVPFVVFPLLIWTTVRFGQRGATVAGAFVSAAAVACTALGYGPFSQGRLQERLWTLQAYMAVIVVTLLVLGAVTEERARAVEGLRRALDAREEFLSIASHELKTPLSAMVLNLTSLQRALRLGEQVTPDTAIRKVTKAVTQMDRLTALIDQLLDVSRISSGKLQLAREEIDLCEVVRDVCGRFSNEARRSGSVLSIGGVRSLRGRWDRLRMEQVLSNLLSNAFRYGEGHPIEVSVDQRGANAVVEVRDHGNGIAPAALPRIFDRFASSKASRRFGGLGLGLYISRQIVEAHRGRIDVVSTVGSGSMFTVELPLAPLPTTSRVGRDSSDPTTAESERESNGSTHPDSR